MAILSDFYKSPLPQNDGIRETQPKAAHSKWDVAFIPTVGKCYEVLFSQEGTEGTDLQNSARIRADCEDRPKWIDLSTKQPLDWRPEIQLVVQGSREIDCSDNEELDLDHSSD